RRTAPRDLSSAGDKPLTRDSPRRGLRGEDSRSSQPGPGGPSELSPLALLASRPESTKRPLQANGKSFTDAQGQRSYPADETRLRLRQFGDRVSNNYLKRWAQATMATTPRHPSRSLHGVWRPPCSILDSALPCWMSG